MEEVYSFFKLLKKFKYVLIIVPIVSVIITFFLVTNLPDTYLSQAQISTGIVDETQKSLVSLASGIKGADVNQEFSNLIEMIRMKKVLDQVSYRLIIHDLTSYKPFKSKVAVNKVIIGRMLPVIQNKYNKNEGLNSLDSQQSNIYEIIKKAKYDSESIKDKLRIYRASESDFINIEFESENPELSAFVVNSVGEEFIKYYSFLVKANQQKANFFLKELLDTKKSAMDNKIADLRSYKIANRVLNLDEQSRQLYEQTLSYSDKKQQTIENIASTSGALNEIERKFTSKERGYIEATLTKVNVDIMSTTDEIKALNDLYIHNDFDPKYKTSIDSLNYLLSSQINKSTDQYIYNPLVSKQELVQKKLDLGIQLDLARYSLASIEREQARLNEQYEKLVPNEADMQSLDREVDIASKEYLDVLAKYNQNNLDAIFSVKMNLIQQATPGLPQPSKKMLLVILSGIITALFSLAVLFIVFLADRSIKTAKELANDTQLPVLGSIRTMSGTINMEQIWNHDKLDRNVTDFKNQLRSLRFEIERELDVDDKVLILTSLKGFEGKSFIALSLAFAWKTTSQKVLIIDGNFDSPKISQSLQKNVYIEDYLNNKVSIESDLKSGTLTVLSNKGGDLSLLEIAPEEVLKAKIKELKTFYDIIIIEVGALDGVNFYKEWMSFGDKVLGIFESGQTIDHVKRSNVTYLTSLGTRFMGWVLNKAGSEER